MRFSKATANVWLHVDLPQISSPEECDVICNTVVVIHLMVIDFIREKKVRKKLHLIDRSGIDYLSKRAITWELQEDPGESLSDCEDKEDDMEKLDNEVDEDAADGFVVPDGYLSDSEVWFVA